MVLSFSFHFQSRVQDSPARFGIALTPFFKIFVFKNIINHHIVITILKHFLNDFSHPFLGEEVGFKMIKPFSKINSTVSLIWYLSINVLDNRMPFEFPIGITEISIPCEFVVTK